MGSGASSPDPCLAGFFALRCFSLITIWVTPESWAVKPITSLPHWFYTRILRVPKCFSPQAFSLTPKSAHNLGITHGDDNEFSLITRSSDGQMLFLANMLSKMKQKTKLGSRIAEVHNGSALFTGDAGQGESNIRQWIIENDWLEAIVALPLNMFYNTGIATYVWVLTNRKPKRRRGKVQLIDATRWFKPLRKNLGMKNCELAEDDIQRICKTFLAFKETEES